jgi:hypothetical protein
MNRWAKHERQGGYVSNSIPHDVIVSKDNFIEKYRILKEKYGYDDQR